LTKIAQESAPPRAALAARTPEGALFARALDVSSDSLSVADYIASRLVALDVRHVFGVGGANIEDVFVAIQRRRPTIRAVLAKHEHGAGTAADAYARVSRGLGVVLATSGGGTLNLVHSLGEARASSVPLLAIVGEPPSELQGRGAFQDSSGRSGAVDAQKALAAVTKWCVRVSDVNEVPRLLREAVAEALADPPGPTALLIAKDHQTLSISAPAAEHAARPSLAAAPDAASVRRACELIVRGPSVVIAGDEVTRAGAERELAELAELLDAGVAVTPDGRDAFDNRDARFLGVAGSMGHAPVAAALAKANVALVVGTRLPLLARQGIEPLLRERTLVSIGREPPFLTAATGVHLGRDVTLGLRHLLAELRRTRTGTGWSNTSRTPVARATAGERRIVPGSNVASPAAPEGPLASRDVLAALEQSMPDGSVVLADAGNTGAIATHGLRVPRDGRWLIAMGMAGMGWAFGGAIGAALASGRRCFVLAGDGAFYMHGLEVHTAVEHALPITFVILNNRAHGMCLVRERLLLRTDAGYNAFRESHLGAGLAAMFPTLAAYDCRTPSELERALGEAARTPGPSVVAVELAGVEVPPFAAFQAAGGSAGALVRSEEPA
jgi:acetolactate synthase-1/2/3 large subunit